VPGDAVKVDPAAVGQGVTVTVVDFVTDGQLPAPVAVST
jgi:hypothetical protein